MGCGRKIRKKEKHKVRFQNNRKHIASHVSIGELEAKYLQARKEMHIRKG